MPVDDWMPHIKTNLQTAMATAKTNDVVQTTGQVYGYNEWPGTLQYFPSALIGAFQGSQAYAVGGPNIAHHEVRIWLYINAGLSLAQAQKMAYPFIEIIRDQFAGAMQLSGTVDHFHPPPPPALFYDGPGVLNYAGKTYQGIIFSYDLKETETFTVSA